MTLAIYVEGAGEGSANQRELRRGFSELFAKVAPPGSRPRIHAGGSRDSTFADFRTALNAAGDHRPILLVDSEGPIADGMTPWQHLRERDGWDRPDGTSDDQAQLMVQIMEAWFLADPQALVEFYGQGFRANALPKNPDIERVAKQDVLNGLTSATRATQKGPYHKTRHGFPLLAELMPARLEQRSTHVKRLFDLLRQQ